ncbi:flavoprotein [Amycolatopsis albispora]|uniref:flavoprotein n=1 Tax=Amycolatopsis albispora TaxID=1804986 RepID=UPI000DE2999E|nr:flavoprotein [Amycolatopsis albispora]
MTEKPKPAGGAAPEFGAGRLLLIATGAIQSVHLPFWLTWLRGHYPGLEVRAVLTRGALRFTTKQAVSILTGNEVVVDEWPENAPTTALHVDLVEWAEAIAVYPASVHYLARSALGLADTPSMLTVHSATVPIGFAPSLPPGVEENPVYQNNIRLLEQRPNVVVSATQAARSATTGRSDARGAAPLSTVLRDMETIRLRETAPENLEETVPGEFSLKG